MFLLVALLLGENRPKWQTRHHNSSDALGGAKARQQPLWSLVRLVRAPSEIVFLDFPVLNNETVTGCDCTLVQYETP
jgi:hypothetical protein